MTASEMRGRFTSLFTIYLGPSSPPPRMASIQGSILVVSSSLEIAARTVACVVSLCVALQPRLPYSPASESA